MSGFRVCIVLCFLANSRTISPLSKALAVTPGLPHKMAAVGLPVLLFSIVMSISIDSVFATRGTELEKMIFKNYSISVRPAASKGDKTLIYMTLFVQHIEAVVRTSDYCF